MRCTAFAILVSLLALPACRTESEEAEQQEGAQSSDSIPLCAAVRGNGEAIFAHFASLAAITERYGVVRGMAGGSSGTITTFIYESMLQNPAITTCGSGESAHSCTDEELRPRLSLALKSVEGYSEAVKNSEEVEDARSLAAALADLKAKIERETGPLSKIIPAEDAARVARALRKLLTNWEYRHLLNPELFSIFESALPQRLAVGVNDIRKAIDLLAFGAGEAKKSVETMTAFEVDENRLFFRAGVLDWDTVATLFGRVGDFYAGGKYGPASSANRTEFKKWLDECSETMQGTLWSASENRVCTERFVSLVTRYRKAVRATNPDGTRYPSRVDSPVASETLHKLLTTSVLEGDAIAQYEAARAEYLAGKYPAGTKIASFRPSFEDVKFGYWGSQRDLDKVIGRTDYLDDLKSAKRTSLGANATWRDVLRASPAEPGLSRFVELSRNGEPDGRYSGGGWSDLAPVLVLKDMGCEKVVYVQRRGDESVFAVQIAQQLGMQKEDWRDLFDLANDSSSYSRSLREADAVWCTDWNAYNAFKGEIPQLIQDGYTAPLLVNTEFFAAESTLKQRVAGCTPGVAGDNNSFPEPERARSP